jgi:hypothetical protein
MAGQLERSVADSMQVDIASVASVKGSFGSPVFSLREREILEVSTGATATYQISEIPSKKHMRTGFPLL